MSITDYGAPAQPAAFYIDDLQRELCERVNEMTRILATKRAEEIERWMLDECAKHFGEPFTTLETIDQKADFLREHQTHMLNMEPAAEHRDPTVTTYVLAVGGRWVAGLRYRICFGGGATPLDTSALIASPF